MNIWVKITLQKYAAKSTVTNLIGKAHNFNEIGKTADPCLDNIFRYEKQ